MSSATKSKFIRYIIVGGFNTIFGYSLYAGLTYYFSKFSEFGYTLALIGANVIAVVIAFLNQKFFVFKTEGQFKKEFSKSLVVYGASILLSLIIVPFLKEICGLNAYLAGAIFTVLSTVISFFGHLHFSFKR
jgi:putative flippase GtrA